MSKPLQKISWEVGSTSSALTVLKQSNSKLSFASIAAKNNLPKTQMRNYIGHAQVATQSPEVT
jgi:hypothetical protein